MDNEDTGVNIPGESERPSDFGDEAGAAAPQLSPGVTPDAADQGRLDALREERRKRQEAEEKYTQTLRAYSDLLQQQQAKDSQPEVPEFNEDDIITYKDVKKILEREREKGADETRKSMYNENLKRAREKFQDFDDVLKLADEMIASNPDLHGLDDVIMQKPNAPFLAYELGKLHPNYRKKADMRNTESVVNRLERNLSQPPNMSGGSSAPYLDDTERIKRMSKDEFAEFDKRVLYG
jgi:hypothetical protein